MKTMKVLQTNRSGLVLMMVMVMMALLATLVMSFLLMVSQTRIPEGKETGGAGGAQSADLMPRYRRDEAIMQLLHGPKDSKLDKSVIGPHSILENLYGQPVYYNAAGTPFRLLENTLSSPLTDDGFSVEARSVFPAATPTDLSPLSLMGTVITFVDMTPPVSLRITHVQYNSTTDEVELTIPGATGLSGDYIINGAPFSGTGIGFDKTTAAKLALTDSDNIGTVTDPVYIASVLRPNPLAPNTTAFTAGASILSSFSPDIDSIIPANDYQEYLHSLKYGFTSANPDYTDADYNTMFLAKQTLDPTTGQVTGIIPSFHRPDNIITTGTTWETLRKQVMRPLPYDHPNFTGGTPELGLTNVGTAELCADIFALPPMTAGAAYDVDNDGDGVAESYWMDIGLDTISLDDDFGTPRTYKPLVAYLVLDLDGRIDLNAHGNNRASSTQTGGGGPAEMDVSSVTNASRLLAERYKGRSGEPPETNPTTPDRYPVDYSDLYSYGYGGSVPDLWGEFPADFKPVTGSALDKLGHRWLPGTLNTSPTSPNPYLFNPNPPRKSSNLPSAFALDLFMSLLSSRDIGRTRQDRLSEILFGDMEYPNTTGTPPITEPYLRNWLTAITADIPSPPMSIGTDLSIYDRIYRIVYEAVVVDPDDPQPGELTAVETNFWEIYSALPADIRAGRKIDINRASLLAPDDTAGKAEFAQSLFVLLCVICDDEIQKYIASPDFDGVTNTTQFIYKRLAQWCINIVDFTDADSIMTPFVIPAAPTRTGLFTNTSWIGMSPSPNLSYQTLWGLERPNIVITETLAMHNRRTRLNGDTPPVREQFGVPQGSAFVELYNTANPTAPNSQPDNIAPNSQPVNLAATAGGTFVWRLAIGSVINNGAGTDYRNDYLATNIERDFDTPMHPVATPERYVWFGPANAANTSGLDGKSYSPEVGPVPPMYPASYLVVGPRKVTSMTARADDTLVLAQTSRGFTDPDSIDINDLVGAVSGSSGGAAKTPDWMPATRTGGTNEFSVSGPVGGYSLGTVKMGQNGELDTPLAVLGEIDGVPNTTSAATADYNPTITRIPMYKPVFLQRLADPTQGHDPVSNPYITVDWSVFDLTIFDADDDGNPSRKSPPDLASRQWGKSSGLAGDYPNIWSRQLKSKDFTEAGGGVAGTNSGSPTLKRWQDWQNTTTDFQAATFTLGYLNNYTDLNGVSHGVPKYDNDTSVTLPAEDDPDYPVAYEKKFRYAGRPTKPFTYLHWNDAPLASSMEVMQVPASSPARFGLEFDPKAAAGYTAGTYGSLGTIRISTEFSHRLNFFHESDSLNLVKIFDYITVPSLFAGTIDTNKNPLYREPGKVNLNTMNEKTYEALKGGRTVTMDDRDGKLFRAADAYDRTYDDALVDSPVAVSRLRSDGAGNPLFATGASGADNTQQALESLQRLSEMTTTRSNTFAVWVTIGLFEVDGPPYATAADANLAKGTSYIDDYYFRAVHPDGYFLGKERGSGNEAAAHRFRDLYIIDRTIPVGFRRGELHNTESVKVHSKLLQ